MNNYRLHKPTGRKTTGLTAIDLFSGAGGLSLGLVNAGFDVVLCSDLSASCEKTHKRNFPDIPFERVEINDLSSSRIKKLTGLKHGELDLLIGGPPCQGFSIIGQRETQDPRNQLFREFLRIAKELKPRVIAIENVTGLATLENGSVLRAIGEAFDEAGYTIDCAELLAAQYGVPQMRWRMFFVGWRMDQNKRGGFPQPSHGNAGIGDFVPNRAISAEHTAHFVSIFDAIGDLPPVDAGEIVTSYDRKPTTEFQKAMRLGAGSVVANHYAPRMSAQNLRRIACLKPGNDWRDLPTELLPPGMQRALRKDHTRRFRRMKWDGVARSIITRFRDPKSGEYIHPEQARTISIREAARIQSFPDWFVFEGTYSEIYEQVGNAVPPLLARAVAAEIASMLKSVDADRRAPVKSRYRVEHPAQIAAE